jgi:putative ABC transport system substrate-binding protein
MPVETQTELELYVNPAAAEAMGVEIPQSMLDEADHTVGK